MSEVTPTSGDVVYTPKAILLTGGAGFIGSNAALRIIREYPDYKVRACCANSKHVQRLAVVCSEFSSTFSYFCCFGLFTRLFYVAGCCAGQAGLLRIHAQPDGSCRPPEL